MLMPRQEDQDRVAMTCLKLGKTKARRSSSIITDILLLKRCNEDRPIARNLTKLTLHFKPSKVIELKDCKKTPQKLKKEYDQPMIIII